ncbi:carboxymuconolactone decarboxylase family protein [Streptomyces sp. NPDC048297]|uniref:carboxymuconolactone decarboxylase family protein n=1 Tax=Streptomyces sp. NPDC048297 TaxID=3365531 RepID=UPI0037110BC7
MNKNAGSRLERGRAMMHSISPDVGDSMVDNLRSVAPDFENLLVGFAFADIWARPGLPLRERALIRLAALAALGAPPTATRANIDSALHIGLSSDEVAEAFLQTLPYVGFPHLINALETLKTVVDGPAPNDFHK